MAKTLRQNVGCEHAINLSTREGLSQPHSAGSGQGIAWKDAEVPAPLYSPKPSLWELMGTRRPSWVSAELGLTHGGSVELAPPRWALGRAGPLVRTSGRCSKAGGGQLGRITAAWTLREAKGKVQVPWQWLKPTL